MTLIKYGEHPSVLPGTSCETCGSARLRPVTDHCHEHGWVRGLVCPRCNNLMAYVDRRVAPKVESALLAALVALWQRCPDCGQLDVADLGSRGTVDPDDPNRNVRYILTWPAWMSEMAAQAANDRAMTVAVWIREAIREKLERESQS